MIYDLIHRTSYAYAEPVDLSYHAVRLLPRGLPFQRVVNAALRITPAPARAADRLDYFGNRVTMVTLDQPHAELVVESRARVDVRFPPAPAPEATIPWEQARDLAAGDGFPDDPAAEFAQFSPLVPDLAIAREYARPSFTPGRRLLEAAIDLMRRIHRDFAFDPAATGVATPVAEVFAIRRGVCQDLTQVMLAALRAIGLPARYISGYVRNFHDDGSHVLGADASHAWVSLWLPGQGWVDLDPTNDKIVTDEHVLVGWGRDYADVSPIRGVILGGGSHSLAVAVTLTPA